MIPPRVERPRYFDRHGFPIPVVDGKDPTLVWAALHHDRDYLLIQQDLLHDGGMLSTVWLGLDHSHGLGMPLIFETMRFSAETETIEVFSGAGAHDFHVSLSFPIPTGGKTDQLRYTTQEEALAMHQAILRLIRQREMH